MTPRRRFLSAALVGLTARAERRIEGSFVLESAAAGHRLRDRTAAVGPRETARVPLVIIGGGMAGLCAAWRLVKRGVRDFVVLEMEAQAGGNSRWGENEVSAFPWAAHYVPVPGVRARLVRELFTEFGLLRDGRWEERHLCHAPQERLFLHGRWQEGLWPEVGATRRDHAQYRAFEARMKEFQGSGEFELPMETGRLRLAELDRLSMAEWMRRNAFDSPYLNWYVDYACRDDYGLKAANTSAWAGLHYFVSREPDEKGPLTWPQGNGWIVERLLERVGSHVRTGSAVHRIERQGTGWLVSTGKVAYRTGAVIYAAPTFLLPYLMDGVPEVSIQYSPWLTANLTIDRPPRQRNADPAWDNVIYGSPSLGYVVATHQSLRTHVGQTVWTFYWALAEGSPAEMRRRLLSSSWEHWKEAILSDLERAHPDIRQCVRRIDIFRMGHAMACPVPGSIFSAARKRLTGPQPLGPGAPRFLLANSDLSGFSIFEEAQYRGVVAADRALSLL